MKSKTKISLCLICDYPRGEHLQEIISTTLPSFLKGGGECIICGNLDGLTFPKTTVVLPSANEAEARERGKLRNLAIARSTGELIITGDATAIIQPPNWMECLLAWTERIPEGVPYIFGFPIVTPEQIRCWDWIRVNQNCQVRLEDYEEHYPDLALGAGYIGMSRPAWNASGGFFDLGIGPGEDIEFSQRCMRKIGIPILFCDAISAVRHDTPALINNKEGSEAEANGEQMKNVL